MQQKNTLLKFGLPLCRALQELDLAITADLGSLQRLPPLIGYGMSHNLLVLLISLYYNSILSSLESLGLPP